MLLVDKFKWCNVWILLNIFEGKFLILESVKFFSCCCFCSMFFGRFLIFWMVSFSRCWGMVLVDGLEKRCIGNDCKFLKWRWSFFSKDRLLNIDLFSWVIFGVNIVKFERYFCLKCNIFVGIVLEDKNFKFREFIFKFENMFFDIFDWENVIFRVFKDLNFRKVLLLKYLVFRFLIVFKYFKLIRELGEKNFSLFFVKLIFCKRGFFDRNLDGSVFREVFFILSDCRCWNLEMFSCVIFFKLLLDKFRM